MEIREDFKDPTKEFTIMDGLFSVPHNHPVSRLSNRNIYYYIYHANGSKKKMLSFVSYEKKFEGSFSDMFKISLSQYRIISLEH